MSNIGEPATIGFGAGKLGGGAETSGVMPPGPDGLGVTMGADGGACACDASVFHVSWFTVPGLMVIAGMLSR